MQRVFCAANGSPEREITARKKAFSSPSENQENKSDCCESASGFARNFFRKLGL